MAKPLRNAKLQYHAVASGPRQGEGRVSLRPELDDPLSPAFIPLAERGEVSQARFWALQAKKGGTRQVAGKFDA